MGIDPSTINEKNLYYALVKDTPFEEIVLNTQIPTLDIIPSNRDLIGVEIEFVSLSDREKRLKAVLKKIDTPYEFIIIDCPPSLGFLTVNSLVAADSLIIPLQCEYFALEGLGHLLNSVKLVQGRLNPSLSLSGILLTMFDKRNRLSHQVVDEARKFFGDSVYNTIIPRNVRLSESPSHGLPIILYDINSRGAISYMELAKEVMADERI